MGRVRVGVWAGDPIALAGVVSFLRSQQDVVLVPGRRPGEAEVLVAVTDRLTDDVRTTLRTAPTSYAVLVANHVGEDDLDELRGNRVAAVLPRSAATSERLLSAIRTAAESGAAAVRELALPEGMAAGTDRAGLSERETDVLRLMAEGWGTGEIARKLRYSERTVKNVIYGMTTRLNLRNRPHAVAYAVRTGVI